MSDQHRRRPLLVALLVSAAVFLPQGVAAAAPAGDATDSAGAPGPGSTSGAAVSPAPCPSTGGTAAGTPAPGAPDPTTTAPSTARDPKEDGKRADRKSDDADDEDSVGKSSDAEDSDGGTRTTAVGAGPATASAGSAPGVVAAAGVATITPTAGPAATAAPSGTTPSGTAGASSTATASAGASDTPARPAGTAALPGDVLDLAPWYLTLPSGQPGHPDTVENPQLATFTNDHFRLTPNRDGVVFNADGSGVTTKNSHYPRSELREMNGAEKASWSNTSGTHTLDVCEAFTKLPQAKPEVVGVQIHDGQDDVLQIRLEGQKLMVQYADGKSEAVLDPAYRLGTPYRVRIVAADGRVEVSYNGVKKAELPLSGSGWYWKVGAYVQSNASKGDGAGSVGEVVVYSIKMVHA